MVAPLFAEDCAQSFFGYLARREASKHPFISVFHMDKGTTHEGETWLATLTKAKKGAEVENPSVRANSKSSMIDASISPFGRLRVPPRMCEAL